MMFIEERLNNIMRLLQENGRIKVKDLSELYNVSEGMIRKDLQRLEKDGLIQRTYGGAILKRQLVKYEPIDIRMEENINSKNIIAQKAFKEINDEEIIFLDISSTNYLLAQLIAKSNKKITLVTNMTRVPSLFSTSSPSTIISIGGIYNPSLGGVVGSEAINTIQRYNFSKCFIGSCGVNLSNSTISNFDIEDGNTKKAIIQNSKEVYLLIDDTKFYIDGAYKFSNLESINCIISNDGIGENIKEKLENLNIKLK